MRSAPSCFRIRSIASPDAAGRPQPQRCHHGTGSKIRHETFKSSPVAAGLLIAAASAARALDCPLPQPATTASALGESPQDIQVLSGLIAVQGTGVVPEINAGLKRKYPAAQDAEVANYLVTLYCPVVNRDAALSDEKADRLSAFSSRSMQTLAGQ